MDALRRLAAGDQIAAAARLQEECLQQARGGERGVGEAEGLERWIPGGLGGGEGEEEKEEEQEGGRRGGVLLLNAIVFLGLPGATEVLQRMERMGGDEEVVGGSVIGEARQQHQQQQQPGRELPANVVEALRPVAEIFARECAQPDAVRRSARFESQQHPVVMLKGAWIRALSDRRAAGRDSQLPDLTTTTQLCLLSTVKQLALFRSLSAATHLSLEEAAEQAVAPLCSSDTPLFLLQLPLAAAELLALAVQHADQPTGTTTMARIAFLVCTKVVAHSEQPTLARRLVTQAFPPAVCMRLFFLAAHGPRQRAQVTTLVYWAADALRRCRAHLVQRVWETYKEIDLPPCPDDEEQSSSVDLQSTTSSRRTGTTATSDTTSDTSSTTIAVHAGMHASFRFLFELPFLALVCALHALGHCPAHVSACFRDLRRDRVNLSPHLPPHPPPTPQHMHRKASTVASRERHVRDLCVPQERDDDNEPDDPEQDQDGEDIEAAIATDDDGSESVAASMLREEDVLETDEPQTERHVSGWVAIKSADEPGRPQLRSLFVSLTPVETSESQQPGERSGSDGESGRGDTGIDAPEDEPEEIELLVLFPFAALLHGFLQDATDSQLVPSRAAFLLETYLDVQFSSDIGVFGNRTLVHCMGELFCRAQPVADYDVAVQLVRALNTDLCLDPNPCTRFPLWALEAVHTIVIGASADECLHDEVEGFVAATLTLPVLCGAASVDLGETEDTHTPTNPIDAATDPATTAAATTEAGGKAAQLADLLMRVLWAVQQIAASDIRHQPADSSPAHRELGTSHAADADEPPSAPLVFGGALMARLSAALFLLANAAFRRLANLTCVIASAGARAADPAIPGVFRLEHVLAVVHDRLKQLFGRTTARSGGESGHVMTQSQVQTAIGTQHKTLYASARAIAADAGIREWVPTSACADAAHTMLRCHWGCAVRKRGGRILASCVDASLLPLVAAEAAIAATPMKPEQWRHTFTHYRLRRLGKRGKAELSQWMFGLSQCFQLAERHVVATTSVTNRMRRLERSLASPAPALRALPSTRAPRQPGSSAPSPAFSVSGSTPSHTSVREATHAVQHVLGDRNGQPLGHPTPDAISPTAAICSSFTTSRSSEAQPPQLRRRPPTPRKATNTASTTNGGNSSNSNTCSSDTATLMPSPSAAVLRAAESIPAAMLRVTPMPQTARARDQRQMQPNKVSTTSTIVPPAYSGVPVRPAPTRPGASAAILSTAASSTSLAARAAAATAAAVPDAPSAPDLGRAIKRPLVATTMDSEALGVLDSVWGGSGGTGGGAADGKARHLANGACGAVTRQHPGLASIAPFRRSASLTPTPPTTNGGAAVHVQTHGVTQPAKRPRHSSGASTGVAGDFLIFDVTRESPYPLPSMNVAVHTPLSPPVRGRRR